MSSDTETKPVSKGSNGDNEDYKKIAFALLRKHFDRVIPPLPDEVDLAALITKKLEESPADDPYFRKLTYALLREQSERELPPLPDDVDLEAFAVAEGALPLEAFIGEIERL